MGVLTTGLGLGLLAGAGLLAARRVFGLPTGLPSALGAVVLGWAWLTIGVLILGTAGWLGRGPLLGWLALGLAASTGLGRAGGRHGSVPASAVGGWGMSGVGAVGLATWAAIVLGVPSLIFAVKVVSDGPIYHLYFAARWWQDGRIGLIPTPFGEGAAPYFPAVGDLWLTGLFVAWGGDRLARVGQAPFLLVAAGAVYAIARRVGAGPSASAIASAGFATVTPLILFSFEPNVDTIFVAGTLLAVSFALRYLLGDDGIGSLVLACLAAGGAWGTKAPGVVFIPPALGLLALAILAGRRPRRETSRALAVVALVPLVLEGYWLARNARLTGNPLYPLDVSAFGRTWLAGWFGPGAMPTSPYYIPIRDIRALGDILLSVLDPRLVPLWALSLAGAWALGRPTTPEGRATWACAGLAVLNVGLYWLVIPYRTQQRFLLHSIGLAAVPLAVLLDRSAWLRWLAVAGLALHVLTPQGWPWGPTDRDLPWDLTPAIPNAVASPVPFFRDLAGPAWGRLLVGIGAIGFAATLAWARRGRATRWAVPATILAGLIAAQAALIAPPNGETLPYRFPAFRDYLLGWIDLDSRTGRGGTRIAYAGMNLPYYLMGRDFANRVSYVNVDAHPGWLLHDYHRAAESLGLPRTWPDTRPGWDRARPDYAAWRENLRAEAVQILVVARANPAEGRLNVADAEGFPVERVWADAHPESFALLYADPLFRTYGLREPPR